MKLAYPILISLTALTSCIMSPGTYTEFSRTYSPDSTKYLLRYDYVQGAWDGGHSWSVAIVRAGDSAREAAKNYSFSNYDFDEIYWQGNDTVILAEKYTDFMSEGVSKFKDSLFQENGVMVKIVRQDPIDSSYQRKIFYHEVSPDKKHELVVYRYVKPVNGNYFLNISIINKNDSVPKYGNFYISKYDFDCFSDIRWDSMGVLDIKVSSSCYYSFSDYLVRKHPDVKYNVRIDDTVRGNIQAYAQ